MHEYNKRQSLNTDILNSRIDEIMHKVPSYKQYNDEISSISVASAKARLRGDSSSLDMLANKVKTLESKMVEALVNAGYSRNYLDPIYTCNDCKDTGYIGNAKCHCFRQAEINLLYRQSNIKDILSKENFDTFDIRLFSDNIANGYDVSPRQNMSDILNVCKEFTDEFPNGRNLLFMGEPGVGKTFMTNCVAKAILDKSYSVLYLSAIELFEYFSSKNDINDYSGLDNSRHSMQIIDCDLLIIDDLGTEVYNSFTNSKLFYCINQRILENRSTIISTNFNLEQMMNAYSERILSRIMNSYQCIKLIGTDLRFNKNR